MWCHNRYTSFISCCQASHEMNSVMLHIAGIGLSDLSINPVEPQEYLNQISPLLNNIEVKSKLLLQWVCQTPNEATWPEVQWLARKSARIQGHTWVSPSGQDSGYRTKLTWVKRFPYSHRYASIFSMSKSDIVILCTEFDGPLKNHTFRHYSGARILICTPYSRFKASPVSFIVRSRLILVITLISTSFSAWIAGFREVVPVGWLLWKCLTSFKFMMLWVQNL